MNIQLPALPAAALLALSLLALPGGAATTNIAQVPLLNIDGTGSVKPNLMLLFDNSGSMDQAYTPDYVNDNLCRSRADLASGVTGCNVGHPPFMSPDFNKQYYNPAIRYAPPIKADGSYYDEMNAANTSNWTVVTGDGFGAHKTDMYGSGISNTNLVTGFPDLKWCDPSDSSNCRLNTATYTYPNNSFYSSATKSGNPYYYTISVAEYCTDDTMKTCKSTSVGAAAPAGYPVPAKVRWCNSTALTTCQAKRVGTYIYPRYSTVLGTTASYGTIAIGASATTTSLSITSVTIPDPSTARTITNGTVTASTGTNTLAKQQALASALAASIIAKTGLTTQYWACVNTPVSQPSVAACSSYGIVLGGDNIVAVLPVVCSGSKSAANCTVVDDASRAGWGITVNSPTVTISAAVNYVPPTAVLSVSGTSSSTSPTPVLASVNYKGAALATSISLGKSASAATVAGLIVSKIGVAGTVRAYAGGNAITPACAALSSPTTKVCIVESNGSANGGAITVGTLNNTANGNLAFATTAAAGYVAAANAVTDAIPIATTALAAPSTFSRVDIVSTRDNYPIAVDRSDCVTAAGSCSYAEEMTNFANWYAYYKTRLQMMKTSVGIAFAPLTANYRVGYAKLSVMGAAGAVDIKPGEFNATARATWYTTLYNTTTSGSTPTRPAMHNIGKMFANLSPYNYDPGAEVVQFPCQQNFMILTTDGYWNGGSAAEVLNNDNVENAARFCTKAGGCVDTRTQSQPSISDVALYWYNGGSNTGTVSLRPALEPDMTKPGLVSAGAGENTHLHMTTYTLGLGVDGIMSYDPDYDNAKIKVGGDFYKLISGVSSGCAWNSNNAYVWPNPDTTNTASTVQERVDDLWHAAINGHGKYFSASDPKEVVAGLSEAITKLQVKVGAAAAAATSTPNISQEDKDIFSATFTTVRWFGELSDRYIDTVTGVVVPEVKWSTSAQLGKQVGSATDTRTILWLDPVTNTLKNFLFSEMLVAGHALEQSWFANQCGALAQCTLLSADNKSIANSGANMVNWLRGQQQYANDTIYRSYYTPAADPSSSVTPVPVVLGDVASAKPAYLYDARKAYLLDGYAAFKAASLARTRTLFAAANDGMLHAFYAPNAALATVPAGQEGGKEIWAYAPRITMKKLALQASTGYGTNHQFSVDGSPELADVQIGGVWKTVLVAGLNGGGRGYYAIDVTNPTSPQALWELCADSVVCAKNDPDLGLSFGNPQFGKWNNKWVVYLTSGYNNVPGVDGVASGSGLGYLYIVDVATGTVLKKISTGSGSLATPSGLAKITAITANPASDPVTTYIYGGDNQGQMWRFDLSDASGASVPVLKMGDAGTAKPITTRPDVTTCKVDTRSAEGTVTSTAQRVVVFGTGRLLDIPDVTDISTQSLYLLKDSGATIADLRGSSMVEQTLSRIGTGGSYTVTDNDVDLSLKNGWYLDWKVNAGERMNLDPKIVSGAINVVTNIPSAESTCTVGGTSNVYQYDACSGSYVSTDQVVGGTLSNNSAAVGFIIIRLPSGAYKMVTTLADGKMITNSLAAPNAIGAHKVGWRRVKE
ncbi:pilus assembly protein [Janthinobacterium fluminis]|uniref:PilC/PilY family type IV pilus protein n=1 Tax=Janthinobacterium fluminis TaxID=2987524 RepID=A0ABT5K4Q6_9BURK|nr:PilC/PilY family type IV pilus protein [Janthinobacterium fluminis]MDC8759982.1 PilC/PilY family type IV pilus protein [Janthinobacterium fluminis]